LVAFVGIAFVRVEAVLVKAFFPAACAGTALPFAVLPDTPWRARTRVIGAWAAAAAARPPPAFSAMAVPQMQNWRAANAAHSRGWQEYGTDRRPTNMPHDQIKILVRPGLPRTIAGRLIRHEPAGQKSPPAHRGETSLGLPPHLLGRHDQQRVAHLEPSPALRHEAGVVA
jgi:hypothetical protein